MIRRLLTSLCDLDQLVRLHQLGFVAVWPLLGLATVSHWSSLTVAGLIVVTLFFNTYGVLLDDAVHVDVDRRDPLRTRRWVVRGLVTQRQAIVVALLQLPLMVGSHFAAGFTIESLPYLLGAVAGQGVYDIYGKKCRVPPLMEAAEATAALLLVIYGATVTAGTAATNALVWLTAGAGAAFILLVNAFHGSLRDIEVELACSQRTTPIWLGCRGIEEGRVHISLAMSAYAGLWQLALVALSLAVVPRYKSPGNVLAVIAVGVAAFANAGLFFLLHRVRKPTWDFLMRLHVTILILPLMFAFVPRLGPSRASVLFLVYFTPTLLTAYYWLNRTGDWVGSVALAVRRTGTITRTGLHARIFRSPP